MTSLEWTSEFSVHHDEMDEQHQQLFGYVNEFCEAVDKGESQDDLIPRFDKVMHYTEFHFKAEEELMKAHQFPEYPAHKKMHERLTTEVQQFSEQLTNSVVGIENDIVQFLKLWLLVHIKGIDTQYSKYVADTPVEKTGSDD